MLTYCQLDPCNQTSMKLDGKYKYFHSKQILESVGKMGAILFRQWCVKRTMGRFYHRLCQCRPVWAKVLDNMAYIDSIPPFNSHNISHCNWVKVVHLNKKDLIWNGVGVGFETPELELELELKSPELEWELIFWRFARIWIRSWPNWIAGPWPKLGSARKSESLGPENGVSRWRWPNMDIYSQNDHFGLVYDMTSHF